MAAPKANLTAAEYDALSARGIAAGVASGAFTAEAVATAALAAVERLESRVGAFLVRPGAEALDAGPRPRPAPRRGRNGWGRWPACRWSSRTPSAWPACPAPVRQRSWPATFRPTTPRSSSGSWPPTRCSSARPTWTSSPWAPPRKIRPTRSRRTRGTKRAGPAVRAGARRPRWRPASRRCRSAPTRAGRSASRARSAAWRRSSRPTDGSAATVSWLSVRRSTRSGLSRATWTTWRWPTASSAATIRATSTPRRGRVGGRRPVVATLRHGPLRNRSGPAAGRPHHRLPRVGAGAPRAVARGGRGHPQAAAATFETLGATLKVVDFPDLDAGIAAYYLVATAEASSNLARFDGVRYGPRARAADLGTLYAATRDAGFGPEVKRRILLGTYVLSSGYYDAWYGKAMRALDARATSSALFRAGGPHPDPHQPHAGLQDRREDGRSAGDVPGGRLHRLRQPDRRAPALSVPGGFSREGGSACRSACSSSADDLARRRALRRGPRVRGRDRFSQRAPRAGRPGRRGTGDDDRTHPEGVGAGHRARGPLPAADEDEALLRLQRTVRRPAEPLRSAPCARRSPARCRC